MEEEKKEGTEAHHDEKVGENNSSEHHHSEEKSLDGNKCSHCGATLKMKDDKMSCESCGKEKPQEGEAH